MKQGWEIKKLGEIATFQRGLTYSKNDEVEYSNNCVLRSNNIELETMSLILDELKFLREDFVVGEDKKIKKDTILICMSNGSKQHIGKVAFIKKDYDYAFGGFMGLIKPKSNIFPKFLFYSCLSSSYKQFLAEVGNGANITNIKFSDLSQFAIPIPPLPEQEKIVEELDCLSGIIEKKKQQLKEYDALAHSIFYEMFGNPIDNEKGWEMKKVIDVVKLQRGYDLPTKERVQDGDIPVWGSNGIVGYHNVAKINFGIVTGRSGTLGIVYSFDKPFFPLNTTLFSIDTHGNNIVYLRFLLNRFDLKRFGTGTGVPTLNRNTFHNEKIINVPLALQQEFASKIEAIEKQKELIKQSIAETETLFNSRMDYYFS